MNGETWTTATGDVVAGDLVEWTEGVFSGFCGRSRWGRGSPKHLGDRRVMAEILRDSYGVEKQQHTFTIRVLASDGYAALAPGTVTTRKGRNVYRNGCERIVWVDESARQAAADEKHMRGSEARAARERRRERAALGPQLGDVITVYGL
jgi:hypothetical protein